MPQAISRNALIKKLQKLGFTGPFSATRHQYMQNGTHKVFIPNPHSKDIGVPLLMRITKQIGINIREFDNL